MIGAGPGPQPSPVRGSFLNTSLLLGWLACLVGLLSCDIRSLPCWALLAAVLLRTQLHTGLFIIGHDAMHRLLWPRRPQLNDAIGATLLGLYAGLDYTSCRRNHQRHHRAPLSAGDPDGPGVSHAGALHWYRRFMASYLSAPQMARLLSGWACLGLLASPFSPTPVANILVFCTLPLLLSSLQLFLFGTYLPHRAQQAPRHQPHPDSLALPPWLSLLACFHFGYHREHHDHPGLAWFELPQAHRRSCALAHPRIAG